MNLMGIGTAVPPNTIEQSKAAIHALSLSHPTENNSKFLHNLYRKSGVKTRGSVLLEEGEEISMPFFRPAKEKSDQGPTTKERMNEFKLKAPELAFQASIEAIEKSKMDTKLIRHLVTNSCTGFSAPGFDIELMKQLNLSSETSRTHIGFMGCHGAINGFRTAHAISHQFPNEPILVCSVELSSLHYAYDWKPDRVVANSLFSDGAGAAVFSNECSTLNACGTGSKSATRRSKMPFPNLMALLEPVPTPNEGSTLKLMATGSCVFPDSEGAMSWEIGNSGFEMGLSIDIPQLIGTHLKTWLDQWLLKQNLSVEEIGSWAVHPGGPKVLGTVESCLGLPLNALSISREILSQYGNMSSATIFFILEELIKRNEPLPYVALAFGPGLTVEAAIFS